MFGRIGGMKLGSNFLEVMAKVMGISEISKESVEGRGSRPVGSEWWEFMPLGFGGGSKPRRRIKYSVKDGTKKSEHQEGNGEQ